MPQLGGLLVKDHLVQTVCLLENATTFMGHFEYSLIKMTGQGNSWQGGWQTSGGQSVRNSRSDSLSSLQQKCLMMLDNLIAIHIFIQDEAKVAVKQSLEQQVLLIFKLLNILANEEWLQHGKLVCTSIGSCVHFDFKDEILSGTLNFEPHFFVIKQS